MEINASYQEEQNCNTANKDQTLFSALTVRE